MKKNSPNQNWETVFSSMVTTPLLQLIPTIDLENFENSQLIAVFEGCGILGWNFKKNPTPLNVDWISYAKLANGLCDEFQDTLVSVELVNGQLLAATTHGHLYMTETVVNWEELVSITRAPEQLIGYATGGQDPQTYANIFSSNQLTIFELETKTIENSDVLSNPISDGLVISYLGAIFTIFVTQTQLCIYNPLLTAKTACTSNTPNYAPFVTIVPFRINAGIWVYAVTRKGALFEYDLKTSSNILVADETENEVFTMLLGAMFDEVSEELAEILVLVRKNGAIQYYEIAEQQNKFVDLPVNALLQNGEEVSYAEFVWILDPDSNPYTNTATAALIVGGTQGTISINQPFPGLWKGLGQGSDWQPENQAIATGTILNTDTDDQGNKLVLGLGGGQIVMNEEFSFALASPSRNTGSFIKQVTTKEGKMFQSMKQDNSAWCIPACVQGVLSFYSDYISQKIPQCTLVNEYLDDPEIDCCATPLINECQDNLSYLSALVMLDKHSVQGKETTFAEDDDNLPCFTRIQAEIINNQPLIIGLDILPVQPDQAGHAVTIIGYQISSWNNTELSPSVKFADPDPESAYYGQSIVAYSDFYGNLHPYGLLPDYGWRETVFTKSALEF